MHVFPHLAQVIVYLLLSYLNQLVVIGDMFLVSFCFHHRLDRLLAFLIICCSYLPLLVNMPLIDLTFAISATSILADETFELMQTTINNIVSDYDIFRIHYSVIVFGSVATTPIDFGTNIIDKQNLIRLVARLQKRSGPVNLTLALEEAKDVYQLREVRPDARRFLVVIMDNQAIDNVDDVNRAVTDLDNQDVVVIGVSIGNYTNATDFEIITKDPRHIITAGVNKSPVELAKEIIDAIFISVKSKSSLFFCFFVNTPSCLHTPSGSFLYRFTPSYTFMQLHSPTYLLYKPSFIFILLRTPSFTEILLRTSSGSSPGLGHCVVFLGKALYSHGASLHPGV